MGNIPWGRAWQPTPVLLPGEAHGGRSLESYSPWGRKESDTTERLGTQHSARALPLAEQEHLPSASQETDPCSAAADLQESGCAGWSAGWSEALRAPGNLLGQVFR